MQLLFAPRRGVCTAHRVSVDQLIPWCQAPLKQLCDLGATLLLLSSIVVFVKLSPDSGLGQTDLHTLLLVYAHQ